MDIIAAPRNIYSYLMKKDVISDFGKKIFINNFYYRTSSYSKAILSEYANFSNYVHIFDDTSKLSTMQTETAIQKNMIGADAKSIIDKHGKPEFIYKENDISVFVYKWKFNSLKTRCEIHLFRNKVFLINYTYNQLNQSERSYVLETLSNKYIGKVLTEAEMFQSKICDKENNVLFVDDFMQGLKVTYLSSCEADWYEAMKAEMNIRKNKLNEKMKKAECRFIDSL
ncbi:MAG TPA: hypothetical protein VGI43_02360 [Mucilaginibacter sp.]